MQRYYYVISRYAHTTPAAAFSRIFFDWSRFDTGYTCLHIFLICRSLVGSSWAEDSYHLLGLWIHFQQRRIHHQYVFLVRTQSWIPAFRVLTRYAIFKVHLIIGLGDLVFKLSHRYFNFIAHLGYWQSSTLVTDWCTIAAVCQSALTSFQCANFRLHRGLCLFLLGMLLIHRWCDGTRK